MERTVISAPPELLRRAREAAAREGVSLAEIVRRGLRREVGEAPMPGSFGAYSDEAAEPASTTGERPISPPPWRS